MFSNRKWKFKNFFRTTRACGCGPKAIDVVEAIPKSSENSLFTQPITTDSDDSTSTKYSLKIDQSHHSPKPYYYSHNPIKLFEAARLCPKIFNDSWAVVKRSSDPYADFRNSMVQMIYENEIYSRNDLQQLLECFLNLNGPHHHGLIVRAFMDIWNACFSCTS